MNTKYLSRARTAFKTINDFKEQQIEKGLDEQSQKKGQADLKSYAKKVPVYIQTNGLLATVAFIKKKSENDAYKCIYQLITDWYNTELKPHCNSILNEKKVTGNDIIPNLVILSVAEYKYVEQEIIELFTWFRRFAEGELNNEG